MLFHTFPWSASILVWLALSLSAAGEDRTGKVDATAQERVAELIQSVLGPYRVENILASGSTNSTSVTYTNIEANFREASRLMPDRLDLRFGIASALIGQASQTNAPFMARMNDALQVYREIHALDTNGFQAALLYSAYARAIRDTNASEAALTRFMAAQPEKTSAYRETFQRIEEILQLTPSEAAPTHLPAGREHAIVVLGAGLETNGVMKANLVGRLRQALVLARLYPEALILLTGGNQKAGLTEAYTMSDWLMREGISTNRLHLEDQARDTVGNAIHSCGILQKLGVTHVTLVTSGSHLKRALALFEEAARQRGLRLTFSHVVAKDVPEIDEGRERVAIYRDVLRTSGLWAFPGIQR